MDDVFFRQLALVKLTFQDISVLMCQEHLEK